MLQNNLCGLENVIFPIFTQLSELREYDLVVTSKEELSAKNAKIFLWHLGIDAMPSHIFTFLAETVAKCAAKGNVVMRKEYIAYVGAPAANAFRNAFTYHIKIYYDTVHDNLVRLCEMPVDAYFESNKKFVQMLANVFHVYGKNIKL